MSTRPSTSAMVAAAVAATAGTAAAAWLLQASVGTRNRPPVITTTLPDRAVALAYQALRFDVTVTDPDGDPVSARVLRAPRDLVLAPWVSAPSGTRHDVVWYPTLQEGGLKELVIEAWDSNLPGHRVTSRFVIAELSLGIEEDFRMAAVDMDGDSGLEIVAPAPGASVAGRKSAGAIARFEAPPPPPRKPITTHDAFVPPLGSRQWQAERLHDVTGDGLPDVLCGSFSTNGYRGLLLYAGNAPPGYNPPLAELLSSDRRGTIYQLGDVLFEDVNHDGIDDVIAAFPTADTTAVDAGELRIFAGGSGLTGTAAPLATLQVPGAIAGDRLGDPAFLFPVLYDDVTGDGERDLVVLAPLADVGGVVDAGSIYVWAGGPGLSGAPAPTATLQPSGSLVSYMLGDVRYSYGFHLVDVTGDGIKDVVAADPQAPGGGAVFVWKGGPTLVGTVDATADLVSSTRKTGDAMGAGSSSLGLQFADLNLDGITDVIASAQGADIGTVADAGAVFFFAGGALAGTVTETARLRLASPTKSDLLSAATAGLQIADVTGDGAPDLVEASQFTATAADSDAGAIHVWAARATGLAGDVFPTASLEVGGAHPSRRLTATNSDAEDFGTGLVLADVTGDGILDVLASGGLTDLGISGNYYEGAVYFWAGGPGLTGGGVVAPTATLLEPNPVNTNYLGLRFGDYGQAVRTIDFNGDGVRDVIACESFGTSYYGHFPSARILVWFGGAGLAGTPLPDASAETDEVQDDFTLAGRDFEFVDVTGDGYLDLVASARRASDPTYPVYGAIHVFAGGPGIGGSLPILQRLQDLTGNSSYLSMGDNQGTFADVDADGYLDVIVADPGARVVNWDDGAVLWFRGPVTSTPIVPQFFTAPDFGANARLGY